MGAVLLDASSRAAHAQEPSLLWHLQGERAKFAAGGDWEGVNVLNWDIMALAKGKSKGKGAVKGDFRAKGASPKSACEGGDGFDGNCHHCGAYSHPKAQGKGNGKGLFHAGTNEEDDAEDQEKEESEHQSEGQLTMRGGLVRRML